MKYFPEVIILKGESLRGWGPGQIFLLKQESIRSSKDKPECTWDIQKKLRVNKKHSCTS